MKLLYLHDRPLDSEKASVVQVLHMCAAFSELGQAVTLAVPEGKLSGERLVEFASRQLNKPISISIETYKVRRFPANRLASLSVFLGARKLIRSTRFDWAYLRNSLLLNAVIPMGRPVVFEAHNDSLHDRFVANFPLTLNLLKNVQRDEVHRFVTISDALAKRWIEKGVSKSKILALHDGVDANAFDKETLSKHQLRSKLSLPLDRKLVVYTGSLYADRGIERILKLAKCFPESCFVILGGPDNLAGSYRDLAATDGIRNLKVLGRVPHANVQDYLLASDVLLMIWSKSVRTIEVCSPLKMFEYMAARRVIVGDAYPTIREVLQHGKTALLAAPDDFSDLRQKVADALEIEYPNNIAENAGNLVRDRYTWLSRAGAILKEMVD